MTESERIAALEALGYATDEARFLATAALQSGYFVRRQFLAFVRGTKGWRDVALLQKLNANGHVRATAYRHNRMVYHLGAKPLYAALGDEDNRNRRERRPLTIKSKLMTLDFVLAHPQHRFLATEREKLDYFVGHLGINTEKLPTRWYQNGDRASGKHFVDKFPIGVSEDLGDPVVHFAYTDEGQQSTQGFASYLRQYRQLFMELAAARVIYVAGRERLFEKAHAAFQSFTQSLGGPPPDPETEQLLDYFRARQKYEARDFAGFDTSRLIRYREEKKRFAGEHYHTLYASWREHGDQVLMPGSLSRKASVQGPRLEFGTYLLEHDYDLFGTLTSVA